MTLHLTLKKKWFDMIASGEKKEEYRELKPYWMKRLMIVGHPPVMKSFETVVFRNGYSPDSPTMEVEIQEIEIEFGNQDWGGDPMNLQFVIRLGKIISQTH